MKLKLHTNDFKENIVKAAREIDSIISYTLNDTEMTLEAEDLNAVTPHFKSNILKSAMKELEIDSNVEIPKGTIVNYQFGLKVNGEYEYINFGNYIVDKIEKQEDTQSYKITCYDKMLYSMVEYDEINITYPTTVRTYLNAICQKLGLSFKNTNSEFVNYNKTIGADLYKGLQYTFRDVLDEIAQVTASTICINEDDDSLEIRYINNTGDEINEEYLKNVNVNFKEKYGPINTIVFSRSAGADKIALSYPENLPDNEKNAIEIANNQILNFNNRGEFIAEILNKLYGLEYYLNDFASYGIGYYNLCDKYNIVVGENTYPCIMFNDEFLVTQGLEENVYTEMPEGTETDYTKTDKTDRRINETYLIVDKQNQTIESVVSNVDEQNTKISQITQTVDELNSKIQDIADITISGESNYATFTLDNINESEPIQIKVKPISENISYLYPNTNLYPSDNLYLKVRTIRFHNNTTNTDIDYELPDDLLIYDNETYDEFYLDYDSQTCQVTKRCQYNADGSVSPLATEQVINYPYPTITLTDGDYALRLIGYQYGYLFVRLMAKNIYTSQFYTKAETNSRINQKADEINLGVTQTLSNYSTTEQMNTAINITANSINQTVENNNTKANIIAKINDNTSQAQIEADVIDLSANDILNLIAGNELNLTSKNITIKSTNFEVDKDGNTTCKNLTATGGTIGSWTINNAGLSSTGGYFIKNITLTTQGKTYKAGLTNIYTMSDILICYLIIQGIITVQSGTPEFSHYDVNGDGVINTGDLFLIRQMMSQ